jgi:hypothetical protein
MQERIPAGEIAAGSGVVRQKKNLQVIEEPLPAICRSPAPGPDPLQKTKIHCFPESRRH